MKIVWFKRKNCWSFRDNSLLLYESKYKAKYGEGLRILASKQMLQRLPIALAQVQVGNTSENLLNEIRQIMYFLYQANKIVQRVHNNIMILTKL